jgi:hypothetical protein
VDVPDLDRLCIDMIRTLAMDAVEPETTWAVEPDHTVYRPSRWWES